MAVGARMGNWLAKTLQTAWTPSPELPWVLSCFWTKMQMPSGLYERELTVLGEFKPFGLIAGALDDGPPDNVAEKYDYFIFDPEIVRERDDIDDGDAYTYPFSDLCDHEIFIRGNRIIWSTGSRVFKRFTSPSPVIMPAAEGSSAMQSTYLSTSPLLGVFEISRPRREIGHSPQHSAIFLGTYDHVIKADTMPSHLILKDLLEECQMQHSVWIAVAEVIQP